MKTRNLQINHPSELNSLTIPRPFRKPNRGVIRLSPEFNHPDKEQWEADINRFYYACGCPTSAKALLLMLLVGIGAGITTFAFDVLPLAQAIALPFALAILGAVVGKISGLSVARRRLVRVVHTVQAHWKPDDQMERPMIVCG